MKINFFFIVFMITLMAACDEEHNQVGEFENIPKTNSSQEISEVLRNQQDAWNQGDIRKFMTYYLNSEELTFATKSGIAKGHERVLNRYLDNYGSPEEMGTLKFNILEFRSISPTAAYVIGEWALKRSPDNPSGYFTLVWEKVDGKWKIIHDHTS